MTKPNPTPRPRFRLLPWSLCALLPSFAGVAQETTRPVLPDPSDPKSEKKADEPILLTPFTVDASKDQGYYAQNTLAGSRMNSNLFDLAASITVVTKQQLEDTASFDVNDVFRYEANTEGSSTYTPQILNRNFIKDSIAGYSEGAGDSQTNATSNRVRGLGVATPSLNYYQTNPRIPFDAYNTQSIEISRGPNSLLFGLGSPAGIVNQTSSQATLNRDTNTVSASYGSYGSIRGSFAFNRSLVPDKLALYGAMLYDDRQFARKPSHDLTRRQYAAITVQPFKKTKLRGSLENFDNDNRRPNFISPRDYVTPWLESGRPAWNPITRRITILDTGVPRPGIYAGSNTSPYYTSGYNTGDSALHSSTINQASLANPTRPNPMLGQANPQYVSGIVFVDNARPVWRINNGQEIDFFQKTPPGVVPYFVVPPLNQNTVAPAQPTDAVINANPTLLAIRDRRWTTSNGRPAPTYTENGVTYTMGTYNSNGVIDKSIYDWESINLNEANYGTANGKTYNVELEQQFTKDLFFSAGWLRQDYYGADTYTISQQQGLTLHIDTNSHLINGQPNPYFGLPYVEDFQPDTSVVDELRDNYRAALAYNLDFTTSSNRFVKWLGRHQLMGMWSNEAVDRKQYRKRLHYVTGDAEASLRYLPNKNDNSNTGPTGWNYQGSGIRRNYYLANPGDRQATVTHATGRWGNAGFGGPDTAQIEVYDWGTSAANYTDGRFKDVTVGLDTITRNETTFRSQREVESFNLGLQTYLFNDRVIGTVGWRRDDYRARSSTGGVIYEQALDPVTGKAIQKEAALTGPQQYVNGVYQTDMLFNRWQRWDELSGDTSTQGVVVRPFKNWGFIDNRISSGNWFAEALSTLSFTYNQSDNFNPPTSAQVDAFGTPLPKPSGEGKDYGVRIALFNNKLVAGLNFFESTNAAERTGAAGTIFTRLWNNLDQTIFRAWATSVVRIRSGEDPLAQNFGEPALTTAQEAEVAKLIGLPSYNYYGDLPASIGATQDAAAKGYEFQLTYNPTSNWTMKATFAKQETVYSKVAPEYDAWLAERLPVMMAAKSDIAPYNNFGGTAIDLSSFWTGHGFHSDVRATNTSNGWTSPSGYYANAVDALYALAKAQEGVAAANQRKYRGSFLTNYNFTEGRLKNISLGGAARWESKAAMGYFGRALDPLLPTVLNAPDPDRPIFDKGNEYLDLWISYRRKIANEKILLKVQLNVTNVLENGGLQPIAANFDGTYYGYRIVDPREFRLTTSFDF